MYQRLTGTFAVILSFALLLGGCSASAPGSPSAAAAPAQHSPTREMEEAGFDMNAEPNPATGGPMKGDMAVESIAVDVAAPVVPEARKRILRSNLNLETKEFDKAVKSLLDLVNTSGGYVESQNIEGRSLTYSGDYYSRSAYISARIPAARLSEVTASVGQLCNIVSQTEEQEDITDTYFDTEAHLKSLGIQEERLLEILSKSEKLEDVVSLERALAEVRYQIESLTSSMKRMDSQVAYSYLQMNLSEVGEYTNAVATTASFGNKLSESFSRSGSNVLHSLQGILLFLVEVLPLLLIWSVIIGGIALLIVYAVRRVRKLREARVTKEAEGTEEK